MTVKEQIKNYFSGLDETKRNEMKVLHSRILKLLPAGKLWFDEGKNEEGKIVSNPSVGYGSYTINYANGKTREFYQSGISANTSGISVYVMGLKDKTYLDKTYGNKIGKAKVSSYCISFKTVEDINLEVLTDAVQYGFEHSGEE